MVILYQGCATIFFFEYFYYMLQLWPMNTSSISRELGYFLSKYAPLLYGFITLLRTVYALEVKKGHLKTSITWSAVDRNNNPVPWFTYPAIAYLDSLNLSDKDVFEYGSGNSTVYFAKKARSITSVESDESWFQEVKQKLAQQKRENAQLIFCCGKQDYVGQLEKSGRKYDIIVIDGLYREECSKIAQKYLKPEGIIILDDDDSYTEAAKILGRTNLLKIPFGGFCPIIHFETVTAFYISYA